MKKIILSAGLLLFTASLCGAAGKRLSSMSDMESGYAYVTSFTYDDAGRLNKIVDDSSVVTIDNSNLAQKKLTLTYTDNYESESYIYNVILNDAGQAVSATENDPYGDVVNWQFSYTDGKLTKIVITDFEGTETEDITWTGDLLTSYKMSDLTDPEVTNVTFTYSGIANIGGLSMYDEIYGIDLDELEYLAMAGFMGDVPAELPAGGKYQDEDGIENVTATWELDAEGYPVKLTATEYDRSDVIQFAWEENNSGVDAIKTENQEGSKFYTIDGREIETPTEGVVIERKADNTTVKHVIRR